MWSSVGPVDAPETVTDAIRLLESRGYRSDFRVVPSALSCSACGHTNRSDDLAVRETFRFEGATDPADEAIVLGVECGQCGARGVVVSAYGPDADQELLDLVAALDRRR